MPALERLSSRVHTLRLFVYRKLPTRVFLSIAVLLSVATVGVPTCERASSLYLSNNLDQPVKVRIYANQDPTHRSYGFEPSRTFSLDNVLGPGEQITSANTVFSAWAFLVVVAYPVTSVPSDANSAPLFIRKLSAEQLKAAGWRVSIEPGYEHPTWGGVPHDITVRNTFDFNVLVRLYLTDDPRATAGAFRWSWDLRPMESSLTVDAIREQSRFFIIFVQRSSDNRQVFIKRYTREQFAAVDWTVVIEPGHEKPDW